MNNKRLEAALKYAELGLSIIPAGANKVALTEWKLYQSRCATPEEIIAWWTKWTEANPTLVTGRVSGVVALDLDKKHNRTSREFEIPPTVCAQSGNAGEHYFFKYPENTIVKSGAAICGEGVDIRAEAGYLLLDPSVNETGGSYEWVIPFETRNDLAEMPKWLLQLTSGVQKEKKWLLGKDGVSEGSRNDTATSMAGKILSSTAPELWESLGWDQLQVWNSKNTKPLLQNELRGIWESIKKQASDVDEKGKSSQASLLLESIVSRKDVVLFHDELGDGYISLELDGHQEIKMCRSGSIKKWLASEIYRTQKKVPGGEVIKSILGVLEGKASFEGPEIELHNRAAWQDENLWCDLTNKAWQAVRINKDGWDVVDKPPIIFKRYSHQKAQVLPVRDGDVEKFLKYINVVNPEHKLLLLVFLVSCFIPDFPHVMLVVFGAQGASKSTLSRLARLVVDPSLIEVASFPNGQKELIQALAHHYFLFFDNVSHISEEQSDTLCKAVSGGGHTKRELFQDDDDVIYKFKRCIGINGINLVTTRPDLLERSLLLELERINPSERKTEKALYGNFEKDLPFILGGIFDTLVKALDIFPMIELTEHHRMADWALWGCAIAEALGYSKEEFLNAYQNNITRQTEMLVNENVVATAIVTFMEDKTEWRGTPTELLKELSTHAAFADIDTREKYWPKGANILSRRLNELSTPLKQMGVLVIINTTGTERYVQIQKVVKNGDVQKEQIEAVDGADGRDSNF